MSYEAIAAEIATEFVKRYSDGFLQAAARRLKIEVAKFKADQQSGIARFYSHQLLRYSTIRTILPSEKPLLLEDIYVDQRLSFGGNEVWEREFVSALKPGANMLVSGVAGSGKSLLMRRLLLRFARDHSTFIPLFVELRHLKASGRGIIGHLVEIMKPNLDWVDEQTLIHLLKGGNILLLFDGLDEVEMANRNAIVDQIRQLTEHYPDNVCVVSTRPEKNFWYFNNFVSVRLLDFNLDQLALLLDRVPVAEFAKDKFRHALSSDLYQRHRSFLTNPLLAIMMLLSFSKNGNVPDEFHAFYEQAFEVLFAQHDTTKELYQRERHSHLTSEEFKRLLARFSVKTYNDSQYSFHVGALNDELGAAAKFCAIQFPDPRPVVDDLVESLCFLHVDGLEYAFTHRSFQEYFAARFLAVDNALDIKKACDYLATSRYQDSVLQMLFEMSVQNVERHWVLPSLEQISKKCDEIDASDTCAYLNAFYDFFEMDKSGFHFAPESSRRLGFIKMSLQKLYGRIEGLTFLDPVLAGPLEAETHKTLDRLRPMGVRAVRAGHGAIRDEELVVLRVDMQERTLYEQYFSKTALPALCVEDQQSFRILLDRVRERVEFRDRDLSSLFT